MILTVMANPALDVTYHVDQVTPASAHRVRSVRQRGGGKAANVARVLRRLGEKALIAGPIGGTTGEAIRDDLDAGGLDHDFVRIAEESRRTVTVVSDDDSQATMFNEPGPTVADREWGALVELVRSHIEHVSAVVVSGSLPPSAPEDFYARLLSLASAHEVPTVLDTSGPALSAALACEPDVVKPNLAELGELTGLSDPLHGAKELGARGARNVVISLGREGLLALTSEGSLRARPSEDVPGNPTGAGDALVAALTAGLVNGVPWPERLREAVAVSAAAVAAPVAGDLDRDRYLRERTAVRLGERESAHAAGSNR